MSVVKHVTDMCEDCSIDVDSLIREMNEYSVGIKPHKYPTHSLCGYCNEYLCGSVDKATLLSARFCGSCGTKVDWSNVKVFKLGVRL